ncbi:small-conductance mechanosensitive channel [Microbacterium sp. HM58-2]|nr:small-conductance mechanosensitive channel [Microbacterium sp. HM58-2]
MKPAPLLVYSVLRLLAFLVPLAIMWFFFPIFRELWWLAAIFAALIGMSISMLFLRTPLTDASARLHQRRESRGSSAQADADAEDQAIDGGSAA